MSRSDYDIEKDPLWLRTRLLHAEGRVKELETLLINIYNLPACRGDEMWAMISKVLEDEHEPRD